MRDVRVAAPDGVFLDDDNRRNGRLVGMAEEGRVVVLTVILAIAKYLPRGTRVGLLANLETSLYINGRRMMMIGALTPTVAPSTAQVCRARWHSASPRPP